MKRLSQSLLYFLPFLFLFTFTPVKKLSAATIKSVKGNMVTISTKSGKIKKGSTYYIYNKKGKVTGRIKITKVNGKMATGKLIGKSKAKVGWKANKKKKRKTAKKTKRGKKSRKKTYKEKTISTGGQKNLYIGGMLGFSMNSMSVELKNAETVDMKGSAISFMGLVDYAVFSKLWLRGLVGLESFKVQGDENLGCGDNPLVSETCNVNINYLGVDLWGRYLFTLSSFRPWVGLGFNLLVPMSNDTSSLDEDSIKSTSVFVGGGGFDYFISDTLALPFQIEYGIFPASEKVKASYFELRGGFAYGF